MTVPEALRRAVDMLDTFGWRQDRQGRCPEFDPSGPLCVTEAIGAAIHGEPAYTLSGDELALYEAARWAVRQHLRWGDWLLTWNDHPRRTAAEVRTALLGAARAAECAP
jgi:hypothetical protein